MAKDTWKDKLSPEEYAVIREKGTEAPFSGEYVHTKDKGVYVCKGCGMELFSSDAKFDSGTGWPSFDEPANLENVKLVDDDSHGLKRTEVLCRKCGGHLGHLFDDLPAGGQVARRADGKPVTKRYCINSVCLDLKKK